MRRTLAFTAAFALVSSSALAAPILAPPGDPSYDATAGLLADQYQRQQDQFAALETGIEEEPIVLPAEVATVQAFFAQTAQPSFQTFSGKHPYQVVSSFAEYGDQGNFAGVATVGIAARLLWLRQTNASETDLAPARANAVAAARAWHVYGAIGGPGVIARGIRRTVPIDPSAPPLPEALPMVTPLFDASGNPQPVPKAGVWRAPVAAGFDEWLWMDDTSKDQVSGYVLAATWLWDALHGDPMVPAEVTDDIASDLVALAKALMMVAPEYGIDLCIRDADGRLVDAHDLNPRQIVPDAVIPAKSPLRNGFNAAMALGVIAGAYHVSGDPDVGAYYYQELIGNRDFPGEMTQTTGAIFMGTPTNYSNVNMLAISLALIGRFETDAYVRSQLEVTLQTQFWSTGDTRDVLHSQQAWFDAVYGSYAKAPQMNVRSRVSNNLDGFQPAPAFERDRVNCDDTEIAAGVCTAIDGTTQIVLAKDQGHGGGLEAVDIVPMSLRPDSDFEWRSDPHDVNGTGSTLMDPGGDYLAAYWLARLSDADDTSKNLTNAPRMALPYTMGASGAGGAAGASGGGGEGGAAGAAGEGGAAGAASGAGGASAGEAGASGAGAGTGTGGGGIAGGAGIAGAAGNQGAPSADATPSDSSGCGCSTESRAPSGALAGLLIALGLVARRRIKGASC